MLISNLRGENNDLVMTLNQRDQEILQLRDTVEKSKKMTSKDAQKLKRSLKDKEKDVSKMREELKAQRQQNEEFRNKIEELVRQRQNLNNSNS